LGDDFFLNLSAFEAIEILKGRLKKLKEKELEFSKMVEKGETKILKDGTIEIFEEIKE